MSIRTDALAVAGAGLVLTILGPATRGLPLLLAVPAYSGAVWPSDTAGTA